MIGLHLLAQLAVVANAPDTATSCAPIEITVAARAPGRVAPRIEAAGLPSGMQLLRSSVANRVETDGAGRPSGLTELTYVVTSDATGRITLPTFVATAGSASANTPSRSIDLHSAGSLPPVVMVRAWLDRGGRGAPDTLFVGQQVDYVVDVQLNEAARLRLRRNPTFFPPEMPGVLAYDLAPPAALTRAGRRCFETLSYRRALFPLFAGRTAIAPAALTYSLPLSTSFFSREETFELRTDSVRFIALDVPPAGRPTDFGGAVGSVSVTSRLSTASARMGDPVVLTLRLEGAGNVKLWPRPPLSLSWASVAQGGERVVVDTSRARVRGSKEFDWLLTPRQSGREEIPPITYQFFDAEKRVYESVRTSPLALDVATATLATVDSTPVMRMGIRRSMTGEVPPPLSSRPWFWVVLAIVPVPAVFRRAKSRARRMGQSRSAFRRLKLAAAKAEALSAREVRRMFIDALGERVPSLVGTTHTATFGRSLRRNGVAADTADEAAQFLARLDTAAFSSAGSIEPDALQCAWALVLAIDAQALRVPASAVMSRTVALLACLSLAAAAHALPDAAVNTFQQGVEAYDRAEYPVAERSFARVVSVAPRAVDAWANLGTSSWAHGDSVAAARAWQRALRLAPLDGDTRQRLASIQPASIRAPGYVPPLPPNALSAAALSAWIIGWLLFLVPPARRPRHVRALAGGLLAVSGILLLGALEMADRLDARGLGVLRDTRSLVDAPGSQTAVASGLLGETGRLGAREGGWVRIAFDGARAGWVPARSVLLLDAPPLGD